MLWVAFELLESTHLWSPFIVLRSVMDAGLQGCVWASTPVYSTRVGTGGSQGQPSSPANVTRLSVSLIFPNTVPVFASSSACPSYKFFILYPDWAFPAVSSLSQRWLEPGNWESFHWKGLPVSQGLHLLLWSLILLLLPLKPRRRPPFHSKTIAALISHLDY